MKSFISEFPEFEGQESHLAIARENDGSIHTWEEFRGRVDTLGRHLHSLANTVVLYNEDPLDFAVILIASIQSGKTIYIPGHPGKSLFSDPHLDAALFIGDGRIQGFAGIDEILSTSAAAPRSEPPGTSKIIMLTSGSTGEPQRILKNPRQIGAEVSVLARLWKSHYRDSIVCSTVSHQHLYGLLFGLLVPMSTGTPFLRDRIEYPEHLKLLNDDSSTLVSSPAFLKRIQGLGSSVSGNSIETVFSSGGPLPPETAGFTEREYGAQVWEIFGSTETGGIAYRRIAEKTSWKPFEGIDTSISDKGHLVVQSDYLENRSPYITEDLARAEEDSFLLLGRSDSIVKIEEKRVSLNEMAERIGASASVESARVLLLEGNRQYLGAAVIPTQEGRAFLETEGRRPFIESLKKELRSFFTPTVLPRKWRFVMDFPVNDMGKESRLDLLELFRPNLPDINYEILHFDSRSQNLELRISFPPEHVFFKGHFPENPILPGVSQIYTAMRLAKRYFDFPDGFRTIPRLKFAKTVAPEEEMFLKMSLNDSNDVLKFEFRTVLEDRLVSGGSIRRDSE